jgi:hypothetical protein
MRYRSGPGRSVAALAAPVPRGGAVVTGPFAALSKAFWSSPIVDGRILGIEDFPEQDRIDTCGDGPGGHVFLRAHAED